MVAVNHDAVVRGGPAPRRRSKRIASVSAKHHVAESIQQQNDDVASPLSTPIEAAAPTPSGRFRSFRIRLYSTLVLIGSFIAIIRAGHVPLMFMIFAIQTVMVKELFALARVAQKERSLPGFRFQQWFFYGTAAIWVYVRFIKNNLIVEITSSASLARFLGWVLKRHTMLSFSLYTAGFVSFVLTLSKGNYTYQFQQYAWTHMILLVVFLPSSFFVSNIFEGIIWFLLPCALVITNDIAAYLAGFFFGRTPLIKLSPKKTWEGFAGGFIGTVAVSWYLAGAMSKSTWLTCPRTDLSIWLPMECQTPPVTFQPRDFTLEGLAEEMPERIVHLATVIARKLPPSWVDRLASATLHCAPMQIHAVALAIFASAIAPFGGFFASGFKRGFGIKDFGHSIPGHGGMTDRMDCQIVMATFSYIYYHNFVERSVMTVGAALTTVMKLTQTGQLELLEHLANELVGQHLLPQSVAEAISNHMQGVGTAR